MWQNRPPVGHQQHRSEDLMEDEIFGLERRKPLGAEAASED